MQANSIAAAILLACASNAIAQGAGPFVEGVFGASTTKIDNTAGLNVKDTDTTYGLVGGFMFSDNFGLDVGYRHLGEAKISGSGAVSGTYLGTPFTATASLRASVEGSGWTFGPRLALPVTPKTSLIARLGWFRWSEEGTASASGAWTYGTTAYAANVSASANRTGTDTYFGLGGAYHFQPNAAVGVALTRYRLKEDNVDTIDLTYRLSF